MIESVLVIIRSSGERTEGYCYEAVRTQVPAENIHLIKERPFSEAVRKTFQLGAESTCKWTLAIDADIIISSNAISKMVAKAEKLEGYFFLYQGYVLDKLYNTFRGGGPHLYRSSLLKTAIEFIPDNKSELRPESATYIKMKERGWHSFHDCEIYGIHDFEQSSFDYYRKGFIHAKKHYKLKNRFLNTWTERLNEDEDIKVVLKGFVDGLLKKEEATVDINYFQDKFSKSGFDSISEKSEIDSYDLSLPDRMIAAYEKKEPWSELSHYKSELISRTDRQRKIPFISKFWWKLGQLFKHLSKKCFHISRKLVPVK